MNKIMGEKLQAIVKAYNNKNASKIRELTEGESYGELIDILEVFFSKQCALQNVIEDENDEQVYGEYDIKEYSFEKKVEIAIFCLENSSTIEYCDKEHSIQVNDAYTECSKKSIIAKAIICSNINSQDILDGLSHLYQPHSAPQYLMFPDGGKHSIASLILSSKIKPEDKKAMILEFAKSGVYKPEDIGRVTNSGENHGVLFELFRNHMFSEKHIDDTKKLIEFLIKINKAIHLDKIDDVKITDDILIDHQVVIELKKTKYLWGKEEEKDDLSILKDLDFGISYEDFESSIVWSIVVSKKSLDEKINAITLLLENGIGLEASMKCKKSEDDANDDETFIEEIIVDSIFFLDFSKKHSNEIQTTEVIKYILKIAQKEIECFPDFSKHLHKQIQEGKEKLKQVNDTRESGSKCKQLLFSA